MKKRVTVLKLAKLISEEGLVIEIEKNDTLESTDYEYTVYRDTDEGLDRVGLDEWSDIIEQKWGYMFPAVDKRISELKMFADDEDIEDDRYYGAFNALLGKTTYTVR